MAENKQVQKPMQIQRVRFVVGVPYAGTVMTGIDADQNRSVMTLHPAGLVCENPKERILVPFSNIVSMLTKKVED